MIVLTCDLCGTSFDEEDYECCPNCGSYSVRKNEDETNI